MGRSNGSSAIALAALAAAAFLHVAVAKKVVELSPNAFINMKDKSKKVLLVEFYSPGEEGLRDLPAARTPIR